MLQTVALLTKQEWTECKTATLLTKCDPVTLWQLGTVPRLRCAFAFAQSPLCQICSRSQRQLAIRQRIPTLGPTSVAV